MVFNNTHRMVFLKNGSIAGVQMVSKWNLSRFFKFIFGFPQIITGFPELLQFFPELHVGLPQMIGCFSQIIERTYVCFHEFLKFPKLLFVFLTLL